MNVGKYIIISGVVMAGVVSAFLASAQTYTFESHDPIALAPRRQPMALNVSAAGKVLLRGTIDSISGGTMAVKSWGGSWTVTTSSATNLMPNDMSQFKQGDFVGVSGTVSQTESFTVDAAIVRDWSAPKPVVKTLQGTASNVSASANTFTLTAADGAAYTVNLNSDARILNKKFMAAAFSNVKNGDTVRVYGSVNGSIVTASIVRDIAL